MSEERVKILNSGDKLLVKDDKILSQWRTNTGELKWFTTLQEDFFQLSDAIVNFGGTLISTYTDEGNMPFMSLPKEVQLEFIVYHKDWVTFRGGDFITITDYSTTYVWKNTDTLRIKDLFVCGRYHQWYDNKFDDAQEGYYKRYNQLKNEFKSQEDFNKYFLESGEADIFCFRYMNKSNLR